MKSFIFLDDAKRPYLVAEWGGTPWIFYLRGDEKEWVSWRRATPKDIETFQPRARPPEQAALYPGMK